jgi:DNA-binding transcriptional LysR family regulator
VSIGLSIALPPNLDAPRLISDFRAAHRAVNVRLVHQTSARTFDLVRSGTLDFAIAATAGTPPADLTTIDLGTSPMLFVCATNHRLANRRSVALTTVASETFIDFQVDWTVRRLVDIGFDAAGLARDTAYVVNETTYLLRFVERGLAVAILPLVYAQLHPEVRFIRLRPALPPWRAVGAHLGEQPSSAAARALMKVFCDQVRIARRPPDLG